MLAGQRVRIESTNINSVMQKQCEDSELAMRFSFFAGAMGPLVATIIIVFYASSFNPQPVMNPSLGLIAVSLFVSIPILFVSTIAAAIVKFGMRGQSFPLQFAAFTALFGGGYALLASDRALGSMYASGPLAWLAALGGSIFCSLCLMFAARVIRQP